VPDAATVAEMMKEAGEIEFTGAVNGTILDQAEQPVQGASVRVGREEEVSDERGRFRIVAIPFAVKSTLAVSHPEYRSARFRLRRLEPSDFMGSTTFRVRRLAAGRRAPMRVLMARTCPRTRGCPASRRVHRAEGLVAGAHVLRRVEELEDDGCYTI
jgi:hypothetical protein